MKDANAQTHCMACIFFQTNQTVRRGFLRPCDYPGDELHIMTAPLAQHLLCIIMWTLRIAELHQKIHILLTSNKNAE